MGQKRKEVELRVDQWYGFLLKSGPRRLVSRHRGCCVAVDGDRALLNVPVEDWPFPTQAWFHRVRLFRAPRPRVPRQAA
ncbi:hypothetical protein [Arenimonas sp.]|uniref:hypothetical protein n=1 Tax=Arenimonas sp. TaxID=1872635 RepID=UPI0025BC8D3F|nr:hypothetical protein [Arenimonas sp.]